MLAKVSCFLALSIGLGSVCPAQAATGLACVTELEQSLSPAQSRLLFEQILGGEDAAQSPEADQLGKQIDDGIDACMAAHGWSQAAGEDAAGYLTYNALEQGLLHDPFMTEETRAALASALAEADKDRLRQIVSRIDDGSSGDETKDEDRAFLDALVAKADGGVADSERKEHVDEVLIQIILFGEMKALAAERFAQD